MSELLVAAPPRPERARHRPLTPARRLQVVATATALLVAFYAWAVLLLAGIAVALFLWLFVVLAAVRVGLGGRAFEALKRGSRQAVLVLRSLGVRRTPEYRIPLQRRDAPGLFELVERTAARLGTQPPGRTFLIPGANAYVQLRGLRSGRGETTLGVGYDLFAALTRGELAAVVAHEIAHARLIQRGFQGWLHAGSVRIYQLAAGLNAIAAEPRADGQGDDAAKPGRPRAAAVLARVPAWLGQRLSRCMAEYSRQHEFLADALSAQVCGTAVARRTLVRIHVAGELAGPLDWRARMVRLEREGSFAAWLGERLTPASPVEAARLEARVLEPGWGDDVYDTHPPLRDRLDALPEVAARQGEDDALPALGLLAAPDPLALRLVSGLEAIAEAEIRREAGEHLRALRRNVRGENDRKRAGSLPMGIALLLLVVVIVLSDPASAGEDGVRFLAALALIGVGIGLVPARWLAPREHAPLPAPPARAWTEAGAALGSAPLDEGWLERRQAELRASAPPPRGRAAVARHWAEACYRALSRCDYPSAYAAAHLCLEADRKRLEGIVGAAVAGAFLGAEEARRVVGEALHAGGVGPSTSWAAGWAATLMGDVRSAEAFLLDAVERRPGEATLWWVLADAQRRQGKLLEARRSAARAARLDPREPRHRLLLVRVLLEAGRARSAAAELAELERMAPDDPEVMLLGTWAHVLLGHDHEAAERADRAAAAAPGAETELRIGQTFLQGDSEAAWTRAELHFGRAAAHGFHPQRLLGEAEAALKRGDYATSRARCLAALDVSREWAEGAIPFTEAVGGACRGLLALGEPEWCRAWWADLDFGEGRLPFRHMHVLVAHRDAASAARLAAELREAIHPATAGAPPPPCVPAEDEFQPDGPVVPCVYRYRFEGGELEASAN